MNSSIMSAQFFLKDLMPAEWVPGLLGDEVRIVIFRPLRIRPLDAPSRPETLDFKGARLVLIRGTVPIVRGGEVCDVQPDASDPAIVQLSVTAPVIEQSALGSFAIFMLAPTTRPEREQVWSEDLESAIGFCVAVWGRNFLQTRLSQFDLSLTKGNISTWTPSIENAMFLPELDLSMDGVSKGRAAADDLARLEPRIRSRVELSLRWHFHANRRHGADALLSAWIAIESIAMGGGANITPLKALLAKAYSSSSAEIAAELHLGPLASVRAAIVHSGSLHAVGVEVVDYTHAVYADVLDVVLGRPCRQIARSRAAAAGPQIRATLGAINSTL